MARKKENVLDDLGITGDVLFGVLPTEEEAAVVPPHNQLSSPKEAAVETHRLLNILGEELAFAIQELKNLVEGQTKIARELQAHTKIFEEFKTELLTLSKLALQAQQAPPPIAPIAPVAPVAPVSQAPTIIEETSLPIGPDPNKIRLVLAKFAQGAKGQAIKTSAIMTAFAKSEAVILAIGQPITDTNLIVEVLKTMHATFDGEAVKIPLV